MDLRKTAAMLLILSVCVSLCSCGYNPKVVGTVTDPDGNTIDITCGEYLCAQYEITDKLLDEAGATGTIDMKATMDAEYEGGTVRDYVHKATEDRILRMKVTEYLYGQTDLATDVSSQIYYDTYIQSDWSSNSSVLMSNGIGFDSFKKYEMQIIRAGQLPYAVYGEGGDQALTTDFVNNYIKNRFGRFTYISLPYRRMLDTDLSEDELATLRTYAEDILEKASNPEGSEGMSIKARISQAAETHREDYMNLLGYNQDMESIVNENVAMMYGDGTFTEEQYDQMFPSQPGDFILVDGGSGLFSIVYREQNVAEEDTYDNLLHSVITVVANERFSDYLDLRAAEFTIELDPKAVKYYSPDKIVF